MKTRISTLSKAAATTILLAILLIGSANAQQFGIYEFSTGIDCSSLDMDVTTQPTTATFSTLDKAASVICENSTAVSVTNSWTDAATPDLTDYYITFTITADPTYHLDLTQISFDINRSFDGPTKGRIYASVDGTADTQQGSEFVLGETLANQITSLSLTSVNGGSIIFKLALFNAANSTDSSKVTIDNIEILGVGPLPIELVSFTALANERNDVTLLWETASETNNDYFTVERSANGIDFVEIMTISGAGNSSSPLFYNTIDNNPGEGVSFYRLKQTDYNGLFEYFNIVGVELNETASTTVNVYPNPSTGEVINVRANSVDDEEILIVLTNVMGQIVYSKTVVQNSGNINTVLSPPSTLTEGIYLVTGVSKNHKELFQEKLIVKN